MVHIPLIPMGIRRGIHRSMCTLRWRPQQKHWLREINHPLLKKAMDEQRENGGTLGMAPLIINPIYTLYSGYLLILLGISPFKGLLEGSNS